MAEDEDCAITKMAQDWSGFEEMAIREDDEEVIIADEIESVVEVELGEIWLPES